MENNITPTMELCGMCSDLLEPEVMTIDEGEYFCRECRDEYLAKFDEKGFKIKTK